MDAELRQASPILVVGMHRSGTRLIARVLEKLGMFMGADQQADSESVTFLQLNEAILQQCGAFWSEPMPAHFLLAQQELTAQVAEWAGGELTAKFGRYTGQSGERPARPIPVPLPFGWKDPRNTFTLPVWRQLFPQLKIIHIVRHGVDVAASLSRRHAAALRSATGESAPSALTVIREHALGILSSRRGWTLAEALTMWEQYADKARLEAAELKQRALEIRFEDLLTQPARLLPIIARFCGVPEPANHTELVERFAAGRAFAFRESRELTAFAATVPEILGRYGYAP
jgi:hypothetical protein